MRAAVTSPSPLGGSGGSASGGGGGISAGGANRPASPAVPPSPGSEHHTTRSKTDQPRQSISAGSGSGGGANNLGGTTRSINSLRPITPLTPPPPLPPSPPAPVAPPKISDEDAIIILQKTPASRDEHEIRAVLMPWLKTLKCKVFDGLTADQLFELAERVQYKFVPPGKTVFHQVRITDTTQPTTTTAVFESLFVVGILVF